MKQSQQRLAITQAIENKVHRLGMDALLKLAADLKVPVPTDVAPTRPSKHAPAALPGGPTDRVLVGKGIGSIVPASEGVRKLDQISVDDTSVDWADSELLGAGDVVQRLNISRGTLDNWRKANKVVALRKGLRNYIYPLRQFERRRPIEGLDQLISLFSSTEETWEWLVAPNRMTGGEAPIEKLREGARDVVISAAEGALDYA